MLSFTKFSQKLDEKLITFANKAYPKFNQVVILAGGAGSGKGFVLSNLLGIEGRTVDVDELKKLVIKSNELSSRIKKETGYDLSKIDLKNPKNVSLIHEIIGDVYKVDKRNLRKLATAMFAAPADRKPNVIFDVTLKDLGKLESLTRNVMEAGYEKKNIHIVWVLNKIDIAVDQNAKRDRVVPEEILMATHEGAALTMKKILDMDKKLLKYMDGDIHIAFNQVKVDSSLEKSGRGGQYLKDANYLTVKRAGKGQLSTKEIGTAILAKIKSYIPNTETF